MTLIYKKRVQNKYLFNEINPINTNNIFDKLIKIFNDYTFSY